jgi:hypothetical protein
METGKLCRTSSFHKRISWEDNNRKNNKTGFTMVKVDTCSMCALTAVKYDTHLRTFYERMKNRKGHG